MKVHGIILSPFVRKVMAVCRLKGLEYEHETVVPYNTTPEFLTISPLGKVPGFTDGDLAISDSSVICEYLEDKYPAVAALPSTPEQRAHSRWLEEYADSKLVESVAPFFFERVAKQLLGMGAADEERLSELADGAVPECLAYLESQLPADGFLFGELGIADIAIACPLINGEHGNMPWDRTAFPRTAAFLDRVKAHPAVAPLIAAELDMLQG